LRFEKSRGGGREKYKDEGEAGPWWALGEAGERTDDATDGAQALFTRAFDVRSRTGRASRWKSIAGVNMTESVCRFSTMLIMSERGWGRESAVVVREDVVPANATRWRAGHR